MSAKKIITKEIILKGAYELLEKEGIEKLNARGVAAYLNCSTQPIYLEFKNMDELKRELVGEAMKEYYQIVAKQDEALSFYMKMMQAYVEFAYLKPHVFMYAFTNAKYEETKESKASIEMIISKIEQLGNYSHEAASKFYLDSWLYAQGIASQIVTCRMNWKMEDIKKLLENHFEMLKEYYGGK